MLLPRKNHLCRRSDCWWMSECKWVWLPLTATWKGGKSVLHRLIWGSTGRERRSRTRTLHPVWLKCFHGQIMVQRYKWKAVQGHRLESAQTWWKRHREGGVLAKNKKKIGDIQRNIFYIQQMKFLHRWRGNCGNMRSEWAFMMLFKSQHEYL